MRRVLLQQEILNDAMRYYPQISIVLAPVIKNDASRYFDSFGIDSTPQSHTLAGFTKETKIKTITIMKVKKFYEDNLVKVVIEDRGSHQVILLGCDRDMKRLGDCLIDLERTGGNEVEIK